jgi:hypothetical protein
MLTIQQEMEVDKGQTLTKMELKFGKLQIWKLKQGFKSGKLKQIFKSGKLKQRFKIWKLRQRFKSEKLRQDSNQKIKDKIQICKIKQ